MIAIANVANTIGLVRTLDDYTGDYSLREIVNAWGGNFEYTGKARISGDELPVKASIFRANSNQKLLFSIELIHRIKERRVYTKTIWNPWDSTIKLRWKYEPEAETLLPHGRELDTEVTNLFPEVLSLSSQPEEISDFLNACYKVHTEAFTQIFPEYKFNYQI